MVFDNIIIINILTFNVYTLIFIIVYYILEVVALF
jgi:hypothetical protein